jgi:murein DD-endopeptidase MepM/ murein hydrolase activator NlpD
VPKLLRRVVVVVAVLALAVVALPANADTAGDLDNARTQADAARAELDRIAQQWQTAEAQLAESQDAADAATARIAELEHALVGVRAQLNERAAELYMAGGSEPMVALLTSSSITEATDRLQYASALAKQDTDLATSVAAQTQELQWRRAQLADAVQRRGAAAASLQAQEAAISAKVTDYQARVSELEQQLAAEQAARSTSPGTPGEPTSPPGGPPPVSGSGWLQTCPVNGATSFVDSFGDPRPGGRSHEGIDLIAAYGTPVVATASGTVHHTTSATGGYGTVLFHDGSADWTFYTHFSSYAGPGDGGHVSAGETIGLVGSTGDTSVNHLHFEYHPGGGAAIDPYSALLGVC